MPHLLFVLSPLVAAALAGLALRRVPWRLTRLRLRANALLWAAAAAAVIRYTAPGWVPEPIRHSHGLWLALLTWAIGTAWVAANLPTSPAGIRGGLCLMWTGFTLNSAAIAVNGGAMPFAAGAPAREAVGHVRLRPDHHLPWLADVIPVPMFARVVSVGDLILMAGIAFLLTAAMAGRDREGRVS
ncbi:DUF5317 family protein [Catellatospora coxensis]|uniref:DUF5317 domain-containing protein n=1 Tax=Catellatospora coxensis TaxID=310354 RepID=A0A8J3L9V7_9ACTN|nr:DUF5317 family protein [Catellatospora coxensis]GIG08910.1 hypothetical protein Cco03nite_56100 [Catellatospora coxensis]